MLCCDGLNDLFNIFACFDLTSSIDEVDLLHCSSPSELFAVAGKLQYNVGNGQ